MEYEVTIDSWTIYYDGDNEKTVTADLVILLPLEIVSTISSTKSGYKKLELGDDLFPDMGDSDLFLRTDNPDEDDLLSNLDSIKIILKNYRNDIIDNISLLIVSKSDNKPLEVLNFDDPEPFIELKMDDLPNPFTPRFEIVIRDGTPLKIKRQLKDIPEFDFVLAVEAKANIDHTIKF
ncbi:MAG: hypothetical protein LBI04_12610 [Treponema sp.]|nr:hypothetical protein [Treponema sp.]